MNHDTSGSSVKHRKKPLWKRTASALTAVTVFFSVLIGSTPARADDSSCGFASGMGYACAYVNGSGTWINHIWAIRSKTLPPEICRSSAWAFYIPPWGGAYGLGYTERNDCVFGTARAYMAVNRRVPSGSRVCTKFMEFGQPVGPEPCVTVR